MPYRRRKPRFSYTHGKKIKGQSLTKNPSFLAILVGLSLFAFFYCSQNSGIFSDLSDHSELSGEFSVHFIDVGQGDSILIQSPDNEFMLIDTGEDTHYSKLSSYLEHFGVKEFKYVVFTHPHSYHIGAAHRIIRGYGIEKLIMPSAVHTTKTFENLIEAAEETGLGITRARAGDVYQLGEAEFIILAPMSDEYSNLNNYSVVVLMKYGETKFLFTGDMERESENEIIRHSEENNFELSADVLKVAHHGSNSSSQTEFLEMVRPKIAVIQVGENNRYNHPNMQVVKSLEDMGAEVLRSDLNGDIVITSDGVSLSVTGEKN